MVTGIFFNARPHLIQWVRGVLPLLVAGLFCDDSLSAILPV